MKDIQGYEGLYAITEDGMVWSYPRIWYTGNPLQKRSHDGKWLAVSNDNYGYKTISFAGKTYKLHRLVALAFLPNPDNKPCINHKDGNKQNNHVSNLEWCTVYENNHHAWNNGLKRKGISGIENGNCKKVLNIDLNIVYDSITFAAISVNRTISAISKSIRDNHKCNGYRWGFL